MNLHEEILKFQKNLRIQLAHGRLNNYKKNPTLTFRIILDNITSKKNFKNLLQEVTKNYLNTLTT